MTRFALFFLIGTAALLAAGLFPLNAFADSPYLPGKGDSAIMRECLAGDSSISRIFCTLFTQFGILPKLLTALFGAAAVVLVYTGLLNLKAYGDDPTSIPMRSIIMKFVLASMFISIPLAMQIFVTTVTGASSIRNNPSMTGRPCLVQSNLMSLRKGGGEESPCAPTQ